MTDEKKYLPFVSSETNMAEFTIRALIIGLVMSAVLGAANAYLGLKAGMTIAATYPAAVIGMALLKALKGTILEENLCRTVGSMGESIAAGAIFTIPAFSIAGIWLQFNTLSNYIIATVIMFSGGLLGIMFATFLRRIMIEDAELPFPESIAAAEIHKAGRTGGDSANFLFGAMGIGSSIYALSQFNLFSTTWENFLTFSKSTIDIKSVGTVNTQGGLFLGSPAVSPAFLGVGYIIGPKLASLLFSGGLLAWGLLVPIILYFIAPDLIINWQQANPEQTLTTATWISWSRMTWKFIVRPIAIGGMLAGTAFTLFKMRKSLFTGLTKSVNDIRKAAAGSTSFVARIDQDINFKHIVVGTLFASLLTLAIYYYFTQNAFSAITATLVMTIIGFFFAAISGYLVGIIGSSNNPVSGLTISTLIIAALLMILLGTSDKQGVAVTLAVAAVICISSAVAGEMLQDLKVGHILGGTPWRMQLGDIFGVAIAAAVMFLPLLILHQGDINAGNLATPTYEGGFGSIKLPAPQAGLMAFLAQGIVNGEMAWPLIVVGILMGGAFILMQIKSPMLASIGMYLPIETTAAIFLGGLIKGILEIICKKKNFDASQNIKTENIGILIAAGLIAGEALIGLVFAGLAFFNIPLFKIFAEPSFYISLVIFASLAWYLIKIPIKNAGPPRQVAPPHISL